MLKLFLEYRANLNSRTHEGWTALMWAAEKENIQALWELLRRGARVNMQNNTGQTALMFASRSGNIATVGLLLKKGGDSSVVDFDKNRSPPTRPMYGPGHNNAYQVPSVPLDPHFGLARNG